MRFMTLNEMVDELRAEARISQNVAHGVQALDAQKQKLRRVQEELYLNFDWPQLAATQTKDVTQGTRYAEYPDKFIYEGISEVYVKTENGWRPVLEGIEVANLNEIDSDAGEQGFPPTRWQNYLSPTAEGAHNSMFEVWPVPDKPTTYRFVGRRKLFPLISDSDRSTLDGPMIVLYAAAEILAANKAEDASLKLDRARARQNFLKIRSKDKAAKPFLMTGGHSAGRGLRPGLDYIPRG